MKIRYQHLSASERGAIHWGRLQGQSPAAIADSLGRPRSTVSRELARNGGAAGYDAPSAQRRYHQRRAARTLQARAGDAPVGACGHGPAARLVTAADRREAQGHAP